MPVINPKISPVLKAFRTYKSPSPKYSEGWDQDSAFIQRLKRKIPKNKDYLSWNEISFLFSHSMDNSQDLKCFLPRLLFLAAFHSSLADFPSFAEILARLEQLSFQSWPADEKKVVCDFLRGIVTEIDPEEARSIELFLDTHD